MIAVALVGTAHIHTPNFVERLLKRQDVKVVAVWDREVTRAKKYAEQLGLEPTSDLQEIWDNSSITAVIICSETIHHLELVLPAVKAGKHLFIEKPLGIGQKDAHIMAEAIQRAGVIFQTGYFRRGHKANLTLKNLITRDAFGKITRVRDTNMHHGSLGGWFDADFRWMADPELAGVGAFGDLGAHSLDLLIWLFGEIETVTGLINPVTHRYGYCDETGEALLKFKNGANATIGAGWLDWGNPVSTHVSGTKASAFIRDDQLYLNSKDLTQKEGFQPYSENEADLPHAFELFLNALTGQTEVPLVSIRDAAYGSTVMDAIYRGAMNRQWIEVGPYAI